MCLEKLRNIKQRNKHDITYLKAKRNELTVICNIHNSTLVKEAVYHWYWVDLQIPSTVILDIEAKNCKAQGCYSAGWFSLSCSNNRWWIINSLHHRPEERKAWE